MPRSYIICAEVDTDDQAVVGLYASDWFECGVNANSDLYPSADAALIAARSAYKGPDVAGLGCRVWAKPANA
jgi:hypothetical protein